MLGGIAASAGAAIIRPRPTRAAVTIRVGKSVANLFPYAPIDVGIAQGFFRREGIEVEVIAFNGAAKMQQGMVAGAIDFSLGSGTSMINILKGVPSVCVAETTSAPVEVGILVPYDSPARSADDLRGKKFGVTTVGSVTEWMVFELARVKGWGRGGVTTVGIGGDPAPTGSLRSHLVDAVVTETSTAFAIEPQKIGRLLLPCSDYVTDFIMHVIYASHRITDEQPETVRGFLRGWFAASAFMHQNRAEAIRIGRTVTGHNQEVAEKEYDLVMPAMTTEGHFDRKGLAAIARSFVDLGMTDKEPDMALLYSEKFLS
ncbi:MAG: sulfonate transporter, periplasmic sulfonate-binding protein [Rhodospirillales bacterium]|nr:sulfonate transporter, periplasmic sulfonate-binding protein [Rhodospirillales bacterium]